ncbi:uncharacterized protein BCR38DRAFT_477931 [Pseudomassariella vexata]|uniref:2EXR domain-containing protein n=1 Tax=Pseudomassariella vexata TaxID=1141098 RepID=A0A1Y2DH65_9PEZI|nr:uncharacterized protein BCR38DRAFT_477931 [Pseudomassariella vexata]ORY58075.1 hypothetical protein BCR38DRAFT_477931 [Pseudomassariella vexata]
MRMLKLLRNLTGTPEDGFPQFSKLPQELQDTIWAFSSTSGQLQNLCFHPVGGMCRRHTHLLRIPKLALSQVCRVSRAQAAKDSIFVFSCDMVRVDRRLLKSPAFRELCGSIRILAINPCYLQYQPRILDVIADKTLFLRLRTVCTMYSIFGTPQHALSNRKLSLYRKPPRLNLVAANGLLLANVAPPLGITPRTTHENLIPTLNAIWKERASKGPEESQRDVGSSRDVAGAEVIMDVDNNDLPRFVAVNFVEGPQSRIEAMKYVVKYVWDNWGLGIIYITSIPSLISGPVLVVLGHKPTGFLLLAIGTAALVWGMIVCSNV